MHRLHSSFHSLRLTESHSLSRMKSLEQDALKAQMVIAKSKEGKKRGTLDQLSESPSPAPTPSPTPMEGDDLNYLYLFSYSVGGCRFIFNKKMLHLSIVVS